jgi:hypothetical protein
VSGLAPGTPEDVVVTITLPNAAGTADLFVLGDTMPTVYCVMPGPLTVLAGVTVNWKL